MRKFFLLRYPQGGRRRKRKRKKKWPSATFFFLFLFLLLPLPLGGEILAQRFSSPVSELGKESFSLALLHLWSLLQVRSHSVKFFLSPFRCCRTWCSYSVEFLLSPFASGCSQVFALGASILVCTTSLLQVRSYRVKFFLSPLWRQAKKSKVLLSVWWWWWWWWWRWRWRWRRRRWWWWEQAPQVKNQNRAEAS